MLKDDFDYYIANQDSIVADQLGKYVVIKNSTVLGYFDNEFAAFEFMKEHELGTFIVKKCLESGTDTVSYFSNRVSFA